LQTDGESTHIKTIVHIPYGREMGSDPHHALYIHGKFAVDENFQRIDGPRTATASYNRIALNHYPIKSLEEFKIKARRGAVGLSNPLCPSSGHLPPLLPGSPSSPFPLLLLKLLCFLKLLYFLKP
jgi:hypothetical protein